MMRSNIILPVVLASLSLFVISDSAVAKGKSDFAKTRNYGVGQPKSAQDLPYGKLRKQIEELPPAARGKALGWLQGFSFPAEDLKTLRVNGNGDISYADTFLPSTAEEVASITNVFENASVNSASAFQLHSRPGSANVLFLDFDGAVLVDTAWHDGTLVALPFDPSGNDSPVTEASFTQDELDRIHEIWHRISEDFSAFDLDVTTEEPAVFTSTTGHLLFTHDTDANGVAMPSRGAGGVAWVNVFGRSDYVDRYSPALVYYTNLVDYHHGYPPYNAEAGSHEFGHNLGLSHDGITDGTAYYSGHGSGMVDWSPIMGNSYQRNVTQWSKGEYPGANNTEDDIAIIAGDLGYAGDDHGNSPYSASALLVEANGDILVSSPEVDPDNLLPHNKGVIDHESDTDWFYVDVVEPGTLTLSATPSWHSFERSDYRGSNMDVELTLMDSALTVAAYDESDTITDAAVSAAVQPGRYYVQIDGVGNNVNSDYSEYASTGMYFLAGSVPFGEGEPTDDQPPTPGTMEWQSVPTATGSSSISMTAIVASDPAAPVEYYFTCVAGENGCTDSGWQISNSYSADGLDADTYYAFKVRARDALGNMNANSVTAGDTTEPDAEPPPPPNQPPTALVSYSPDPAVITKGKSVDVTMTGSGSTDPDGEIVSWVWRDAGGNAIATTPSHTARLREGSHTYTLEITDNDGASDSVSITFSVSRGGGDDDDGGGKPPKKKTPPGKS